MGAAVTNPVDGADEADEDVDNAPAVVVGVVAVGGIGLRPPPASSVAPRGICGGVIGVTTMLVGDEAEAAGWAKLGSVSPQFAAVVPLATPPSNSAVEVVVPRPELEPPGTPIIVSLAVEQLEIAGATVSGLKPGDASSVAPRGTPDGATGAAGPMPSGEVIPNGEGAAPAPCASAGPQAVISTMIDIGSNRIIIERAFGRSSRRITLRLAS
jgi:hypothetical protein